MPAAAQPAATPATIASTTSACSSPTAEVVEEEERVGAGDDDVVDAGVHEVDADRVVATERQRDLQLRADAIGAADEDRIRMRGRVEAEERPEAADAAEDGGRGRRRRRLGDALDGACGLLPIDAGLAVRAGHRRQRRSIASLSSSSGTSVGYTPSKQAVQRASVRPPTASSRLCARQEAERVGADHLADLVGRVRRGDQLAAPAGVDAHVARVPHLRGVDANVDLGGARAAQHRHDRPGRRAAHDRVVDDHDALPAQQLGERIELQAHRLLAAGLARAG